MSALVIKELKRQAKRLVHPALRRFKPAPELPRKPLETNWGSRRGTPLDRYFIDGFLESHRGDVTGAVLEIKNRGYTDSLGSDVVKADVLDVDESNPDATIVEDLAAADGIPDDSYDCFILTETLHYIYDVRSAVAHAHRILKPGGVLLATVPCISPIDMELETIDFWRFTRNSCRRLFGDAFGAEQVDVETYGNYATCSAWITGMVVEDFDPELLGEVSETYVQGICIRAEKKGRANADAA